MHVAKNYKSLYCLRLCSVDCRNVDVEKDSRILEDSRFYSSHIQLGVDRLSAPILSILPIIDIVHFQNRFADNYFFFFL